MMNFEEQILIALDDIRPFLKADGGDVRFVSFEADTVTVELLGACKNCSMSPMTLKAGIEESIKAKLPQVKQVVAITKEVVENVDINA